MSDLYDEHNRFLKNNIGKVVVLDGEDERMLLSSHNYPEEHETVIEAALWPVPEANFSEYKTYMRRGLDGMSGGTSIVNDGCYCRSYESAVDWIENEAQAFGGEPLNWQERERVEITEEELERKAGGRE